MGNSPQWDRDEEYRQSVIRKALLLGFSAVEDPNANYHGLWSFEIDGVVHGHYVSQYSAAHAFLSAKNLIHLIGDYHG